MAPRLGVFQKLACKLGHHHRDGNNVRRVQKMWRSVCIGCGASMVKTDDGWIRRIDLPGADTSTKAGEHGL